MKTKKINNDINFIINLKCKNVKKSTAKYIIRDYLVVLLLILLLIQNPAMVSLTFVRCKL